MNNMNLIVIVAKSVRVFHEFGAIFCPEFIKYFVAENFFYSKFQQNVITTFPFPALEDTLANAPFTNVSCGGTCPMSTS